MTTGFIKRSNIFGVDSGSDPASLTEPTSNEETAAGKLIDHLKWVADNAIATAGARADWLALAANQGQNSQPTGLIQGSLVKSTPLSRSAALGGWTLPDISAAALTLPTIPDNLKVNWELVQRDAREDVAALQSSWMARYLPEVTDVTRIDALFSNILNGADYDASRDKLNALETQTKAALDAIVAATLSALTGAITTAQTNLSTNFTTARSSITDAYDEANSNAVNVAWNRARDQVAREGARQESEAVSAWASRGFSLPGGALTAAAARARQATLSASVDVAAQQAEKSHQMFFDAARAEVESWARFMEAQSTSELTSLRAVLDGRLRFAELELENNRALAKQAFDHLGLTLDFTKFSGELAVKYRDNVMGAMSDLIRAYAALRGNELQYLEGIASADRAAQAAVLDYYRVAMASAELGMKVDLTNTETDLRWAGIAAQFIGQSVGHHVQAASAAAEVFARIAGMSLSGLNGVASVAASV